MLRGIIAILVDSYRDLKARKLFWFVLAISFLIVVAIGSIGFSDRGVTILFGLTTFESKFLKAGSSLNKPFYDFIFSQFVVGIWLGWGAIILALISTAEIFPTFMSQGSIDLILSKPIPRSVVFVTKFIGSLLFVFLQVAIFCAGMLLVYHFRMGEWRWPLLTAIPVITLIFSYLYGIMVLLNVLTRSTLASLLLTAICWIALFSLNVTSATLYNVAYLPQQMKAESYQKRIDWYDQRIEEVKPTGDTERIERIKANRDGDETILEEAKANAAQWKAWSDRAQFINALLPKTSRTADLVQRELANSKGGMSAVEFFSAFQADRDRASDETSADSGDGSLTPPPAFQGPADRGEPDNRQDAAFQKRVQEHEASYTATYIIGTSLIFEFVIVGFAAWLFTRRDY